MPRKKLTILGEQYTKGAFEKAWSGVVNSNECNIFLRGDSEAFVNAVVDLAPKWAKIKARGKVRFKIRLKKFQGRAVRGVVMISPNSKREIWIGKGALLEELFPRAVEVPTYVKNRKEALAAMRQIIEPQIKAFRQSVLRQMEKSPIKCRESGNFIEAGSLHIDHRVPFKSLVEDWCRENHIDLENLEVYCRGTKCYFRDTDLAEGWFDYHVMHSQLQPLSAKANLKKGAKYYG